MSIAKVLSVALIVGAGAFTPAFAQPADGVTMIVPGVYTTPEISAKCQAYAAKRAGSGAYSDSMRQNVAIQCAKKLWNERNVKLKK